MLKDLYHTTEISLAELANLYVAINANELPSSYH